jgi:predicted RNase H-like nuclease (RuvC/YqgF family)
MSATKEMELIYHNGTPGYHIPKGLFELMEFGIKQALSIIDDNKNTIKELRSTLEERDTIYATDLKKELAIKDTIINDLHRAIKEQRDALEHLRGVAVDN